MDKTGEITTIVEDHIERLSTLESRKSLLNAPEVFFLSLTLPGINRNSGGGDTGKEIR